MSVLQKVKDRVENDPNPLKLMSTSIYGIAQIFCFIAGGVFIGFLVFPLLYPWDEMELEVMLTHFFSGFLCFFMAFRLRTYQQINEEKKPGT